jgi:hypothetical protein
MEDKPSLWQRILAWIFNGQQRYEPYPLLRTELSSMGVILAIFVVVGTVILGWSWGSR